MVPRRGGRGAKCLKDSGAVQKAVCYIHCAPRGRIVERIFAQWKGGNGDGEQGLERGGGGGGGELDEGDDASD